MGVQGSVEVDPLPIKWQSLKGPSNEPPASGLPALVLLHGVDAEVVVEVAEFQDHAQHLGAEVRGLKVRAKVESASSKADLISHPRRGVRERYAGSFHPYPNTTPNPPSAAISGGRPCPGRGRPCTLRHPNPNPNPDSDPQPTFCSDKWRSALSGERKALSVMVKRYSSCAAISPSRSLASFSRPCRVVHDVSSTWSGDEVRVRVRVKGEDPGLGGIRTWRWSVY